jgi:hypothetical protein
VCFVAQDGEAVTCIEVTAFFGPSAGRRAAWSKRKGDLRPGRAVAKRNPFATPLHVGAFWPVGPASDNAIGPLAVEHF